MLVPELIATPTLHVLGFVQGGVLVLVLVLGLGLGLGLADLQSSWFHTFAPVIKTLFALLMSKASVLWPNAPTSPAVLLTMIFLTSKVSTTLRLKEFLGALRIVMESRTELLRLFALKNLGFVTPPLPPKPIGMLISYFIAHFYSDRNDALGLQITEIKRRINVPSQYSAPCPSRNDPAAPFTVIFAPLTENSEPSHSA